MMVDKIRFAYNDFCLHNYRQPAYLLIRSNALIELNHEIIDYLMDKVTIDRNFKLSYHGMQIIETNSIDEEFVVV